MGALQPTDFEGFVRTVKVDVFAIVHGRQQYPMLDRETHEQLRDFGRIRDKLASILRDLLLLAIGSRGNIYGLPHGVALVGYRLRSTIIVDAKVTFVSCR